MILSLISTATYVICACAHIHLSLHDWPQGYLMILPLTRHVSSHPFSGLYLNVVILFFFVLLLHPPYFVPFKIAFACPVDHEVCP